MNNEKLIEECLTLFEKTACKQTYDMKGGITAVVEHLLTQPQNLPILDVSYCAKQTKNVLTNKFCNIAKEHVGKRFDEVPEVTDLLKAIEVIEKYCNIC